MPAILRRRGVELERMASASALVKVKTRLSFVPCPQGPGGKMEASNTSPASMTDGSRIFMLSLQQVRFGDLSRGVLQQVQAPATCV